MKTKNLFPLAAIIFAGCAAPMRTINFDSQPQGAHVFMTTGINEDSAKGARDYLGTTPFQWTTEVEGDGTFKIQSAGIRWRGFRLFFRVVVGKKALYRHENYNAN
jgi:hypothetical protein